MFVQGLVTKVIEEMLCFVVDNTTTVHMVLIFVQNPDQKLPPIGTKVTIKASFCSSDEFKVNAMILCPESEFSGDFSTAISDNKFLTIVRNLSLGPADLLEVEKNYRSLKRCFTPIHDHITSEELIQGIIQGIHKNNSGKIPTFNLKFINQMRFVDPGPENYKDLSYWNYGNHWSWCGNGEIDYLVGYLFVHKKYGTTWFTDYNRQVPCTITNNSGADIGGFINKYVLVRDYTVITEIYNTNRFCSLEYLILDLSNVTILDFNHQNKHTMIVEAPPKQSTYDFCICCRIISKSQPTINRGGVECWLLIVIEETNTVFLCLNSSYSEIFPLLRQGSNYKIFHKGPLRKTLNKEVRMFNCAHAQYELPNNAIFVQNPTGPNFSHIDETQAKQQLSTSNIVTFVGKLSLKKFVNPLSSRTEKASTDRNFGTPGDKTHLLEFKAQGAPLTVYLNNWENMLMPYCLVPNMRILVYNVLPQKGRYYKSTAMTSLEIIKYEPDARFDTANLCGGVRGGAWGSPYFLGAGPVIPAGVIIWTRITSMFILGLKIKHQCAKCGGDTHFNKPCSRCNTPDSELSATITLIVTDQLGESKVIAKGKTGVLLLRLLLDAQEPVFDKWCKGFDLLDSYEYSKGGNRVVEIDTLEDRVTFRRTLTRHFDVINRFGVSLDLKCRKMSEEPNGNSLYFLLDARKT